MGELLAAAEKVGTRRQEATRKREAAERRRREQEAAAAQAKRVDALARNPAAAQLTPAALATFKHAASIANPKFYELQRLRKSTWDTPRYNRGYDVTVETT